jgi:hypothetical protein
MALLVWHTGPRLLLGMVERVGWRFAIVVVIYALHVCVRGVAVWRTAPAGAVPFADVLRAQFSAEAVEMLTFTGPFLAEPAKGWLLTRGGLGLPDAFAAVITEHLLYAVVSCWLMAAAAALLLLHGMLPLAVWPTAAVVLILTVGFVAAFAFAAVTGVGLIVPILRRLRLIIGAGTAERAARAFEPIEDVIVTFLHRRFRRVAEVIAIEAFAHLMLIAEVWILVAALGCSVSRSTPLIIEGGVKFIGIAFAFIPGQVGAFEGVYVFLATAVGLPAAAGLTLALVRRARSLVVAAGGLVVLTAGGAVRGRSRA